MDRTLLRVVDESDGATWPERAAELSAQTGVPITEDMARNRHRRVVNDNITARTTPQYDNPITVPPVPEGDYAGFNMAFFDIETSGLSAWGNDMTVVAIVDQFGHATIRDRFEFPQSSVLDDSGLLEWTRDELEKYDILVGWYGTMFDLPFINAKLVEHGMTVMRDKMFLDPCFKTRGGRYGLKVGSSKLKNVAKWLNTPNQKPDVEWVTFRKASFGDPEAVAELRDRCEADCRAMRDIFNHIKPMIRTIHR
jgi:uncharacterized protein YprB with RNaseH-like and TPR domain